MASIVLQLAALVVFPLVVSAIVAYLASADLPRPWLYFAVATGVLYVVYVVTFLYLAESIRGPISVALDDAGKATRSTFIGLGVLKLYAKPLLGFSVMALPILAGIYTILRRSRPPPSALLVPCRGRSTRRYIFLAADRRATNISENEPK